MNKNALVLTGGGARGAYQSGVLLGLSEVLKAKKGTSPFSIISGVSAGGINAAYLAANAHDFDEACLGLSKLWSNLNDKSVFEAGIDSVSKKIISDIYSSIRGQSHLWGLFDTKPLGNLLTNNIDLHMIQSNLDRKIIRACAITATQVESSKNITFVQTNEKNIGWQSVNRESQATKLQISHIRASAALPILFQPIKIASNYYTDGALRNVAPLSAAFHLGADKLIVVGVHHRSSRKTPAQINTQAPPTLGRIFSLIINGILLDALDSDFDRMQRINDTLSLMTEERRNKSTLRLVDGVLITPSKDLSHIALKYFDSAPSALKLGINVLGDHKQAAELLSYLIFDSGYCEELIDLGKHDVLKMGDYLISFLS